MGEALIEEFDQAVEDVPLPVRQLPFALTVDDRPGRRDVAEPVEQTAGRSGWVHADTRSDSGTSTTRARSHSP